MKYIKNRFNHEEVHIITPQKHFSVDVFKIFVFSLFISGLAFAGIVEDASALYQKGEYVKAGEKLAPEIDKSQPSMTALSLGIDIALASGEPMRASRLATTLFRISIRSDVNMLFKSAATAEVLGEQKLAKTRYLAYLSKENVTNVKIRKASRYLFSNGVYPDVLNRYLSAFSSEGARVFYTDGLINQQIEKVLNELWFIKSVDDAIASTKLCMNYYSKAPYKQDIMLLKLYSNMKYLAKPEQQLKVIKLISKYKYSGVNRAVVIYRDFRRKGDVDDDVINAAMLEMLKLNDGKISSELMWGSGSFPDLNTMEILKVKPELARKYAEYFLANEAAYKNNPELNYYNRFLEKIATYKRAFRAEGNVLVTPAQFQQRVDEQALKYKNNSRAGASSFVTILGSGSLNYFDTDLERGKFLGRYIELLLIAPNSLATYLKYSGTAANIDSIIVKSKPDDVINAKYIELGSYHQLKKFGSLKKIILDYANENPHYWDTRNSWTYYFSRGTNEIPEPEKMQTLNAIFLSEGKSSPLITLFAEMSKNGWDKKPEFVEFKKKCSAGKPIIKKPAYDLGQKIIRSNDLKYVEKSVPEFLKLYTGRVPGESKYAKNQMESLSVKVFEKHNQLTLRLSANFLKMCDIWIPRFTAPGNNWNTILTYTRSYDSTRLWGYSKLYLQMLKKNPEFPFDRRAILSGLQSARAPKDERNQALFSAYYKDMGKTDCLRYFAGMTYSWDQEFSAKELDKILALYKMEFSSVMEFRQNIYDIFRVSLYSFSLAQAKKVGDNLFALSVKDNVIDFEVERLLFNKLDKGNQADIEAYVNWYLSKITTRPASVQFLSINKVIFDEYQNFRPEFYQTVLIPKLNDLLSKQSDGYANVSIKLLIRLNVIVSTTDSGWSVELKKTVQALRDRLLSEMLIKKFGYTEGNLYRNAAPLYHYELLREISVAKNWKSIIEGFSTYAFVVCKDPAWATIKKNYIVPMVAELDKLEKNEIVYMFAQNIMDYSADLKNIEMQNYMSIIRAKASKGIKNIIPVAKNDPTYNLYLAGQYLQAGNEARAWQMTQPNLDLLSRNWEKFDIGYNSWVAEQMRKQKMLDDALKFCLTILVKEYDIDSESVAQMTLVKGDIYRDMNNNAAAKMEYQGLVANKRYMNTPAGRLAKYRLIELMIQTKEYSSAEAQLERLVDVGTIEEQADANYYFAKIAFEQGDAEASSEYLTKCFALVHGHVQGRLLEGELKLILPRGLQDPEVQVGRLDLQTVVIPGKTLKLKLQDSNLSIARGGKSIPVVVTTSSGDKESVDLFAGSNDTTLFVGTIQTGLGMPKPGNLLLEVNGNDEVSYVIEPEFQKANRINYAPKRLEIKSDARLVASSGEILTEEEEDRRELQRRIAYSMNKQSMRAIRNNKTVRPGSDIYVELTDFDQDVSSAKDKIFLNIKTSSGDVLNDYVVLETAEHTGIFKGTIPTGLPYPLVSVSDKEEATDPNSVININKPESWKSLIDGVKTKWIEVDSMNSHRFKEIDIVCKDVDQIKGISLYGVLAHDNVLIARYPESIADVKGGLTVSVAQGTDTNDRKFRRTIQYKTFETYNIKEIVFDRSKAPKSLGVNYILVSLTGSFYMPQSEELTLRITCNLKSNRDYQGLMLSIDGDYVFGKPNMTANDFKRTKTIFLKKGIHEFEGLIRSRDQKAIVSLEYEKEDGSFAPLPAEWFSIEHNNELAKKLLPKGKITKTETGFKALLSPATRFRKFRWMFENFSSPIVEVTSIGATDSKGNKVLPVAKDFTEGIQNRIVEVSAGDDVNIEYKDEKRLDEDMLIKDAQIGSSFANAEVNLQFERIKILRDGKEHSIFSTAKRIRKGDQLMAVVTDYDEDVTDERDKVKLRVTTTAGETLDMELLETGIGIHADRSHNHAGRFMQILKFGDVTGGNTIKITPEDIVTVSYLDKENTDPGIPFERKYALDIEERDNPELTIYMTDVTLIEDNSTKALTKVRNIQHKGTAGKDMKIMKEQITATSISKDDLNEELAINVMAPMIFDLSYPKMAMHADSTFMVGIVADSEIAAAEKEGRAAITNEIPVYIRNLSSYANSKGFPVRIKGISLFKEKEMLDRGLFAGVVRLQIGSPGDPINKYIDNESSDFLTGKQIQQFDQDSDQYTVPTILVAGSDTITVIVSNEKGEPLVNRRIRLLSDGRLELLDMTYSAPVEAIHLGQKFYIRLTDPDQDVTDEKDDVVVKITSASNDELNVVLKETLPHSGIFSGVVLPSFIEKDATGKVLAPNKSDQILRVNFGDNVHFEFIDNLSISSKDPLIVSIDGYVYKGADGKLASFTKSFKDPDMAVKTRFLMAEARFEVAKEYRKLKKEEEAEVEIARGKRILEEAMRDYPNTTLKAQGEFLLANLSQELENYQEAIGRYSNVINNWPTSEYAIRSQLKKAICLEKLQQFDQACEEYVKLTYLYPDSQYVADASIRMGNYYYKHKQYGISAQIFLKFQKKNSTHKLAPKSLFLAANCLMRMEKEKEEEAKALNPNATGNYGEAIVVLEQLLEEYKDDKDLCAESMYWLGDCLSKERNYRRAYQTLKKLTWDYPETKWAKIARGRLTDEKFVKFEEE